MPRVRRKDLPPALLQHLLDRIQQRQIDARQLELLARWLDTEPEVPEGPWYKRFSGMTVCGEGDLVKTFLAPGQSARGSLACPETPAVPRTKGAAHDPIRRCDVAVSRPWRLGMCEGGRSEGPGALGGGPGPALAGQLLRGGAHGRGHRWRAPHPDPDA